MKVWFILLECIITRQVLFSNLDVFVRQGIHCLEWMGIMERLLGFLTMVDRWEPRGVGHFSSDPRSHHTAQYLVYG